jgi:hypothetical protein
MREAYRPVVIFAAFVAVVAGVEVALQSHDREEPLVITQLVLEESRDIDRSWVEDTYHARLTHTGGPGSVDFARVTAKVSWPFGLPAPGLTQIVDGDLAFGTVRAGETVESADTITIRRHRQQPLKANQLRWSIDARPDLVPSDAWSGHWRFRLTYKDGATNDISLTSNITGAIPKASPLGLSLLPEGARCRWNRSDTSLQVTCTASLRIDACLVDLTGRFELARNGERAHGHGEWRRDGIGLCGDVVSETAAVDIEGERLDQDSEPEPLAAGLLTSFVTVPGFSTLIAEGIPPVFPNEHACRLHPRSRVNRAADWRR